MKNTTKKTKTSSKPPMQAPAPPPSPSPMMKKGGMVSTKKMGKKK